MPNIKPVSDLRNYTEVLRDVSVDAPVFLTKNGRGHIANKNSGCRSRKTMSLESSSSVCTLRSVRAGQKVRIVEVQAEGELGRRIRDMGLVPGAEVQVMGRAPLRDPVALRLSGFTLSLRNREADHIVVEPLVCNPIHSG